MTLWIVTVKLEPNPNHDPTNKITETCPIHSMSNGKCTDSTGEHHSFLYVTKGDQNINDVKNWFNKYHVTRVEQAIL